MLYGIMNTVWVLSEGSGVPHELWGRRDVAITSKLFRPSSVPPSELFTLPIQPILTRMCRVVLALPRTPYTPARAATARSAATFSPLFSLSSFFYPPFHVYTISLVYNTLYMTFIVHLRGWEGGGGWRHTRPSAN